MGHIVPNQFVSWFGNWLNCSVVCANWCHFFAFASHLFPNYRCILWPKYICLGCVFWLVPVSLVTMSRCSHAHKFNAVCHTPHQLRSTALAVVSVISTHTDCVCEFPLTNSVAGGVVGPKVVCPPRWSTCSSFGSTNHFCLAFLAYMHHSHSWMALPMLAQCRSHSVAWLVTSRTPFFGLASNVCSSQLLETIRKVNWLGGTIPTR